MSSVYVLDSEDSPCAPCSSARARVLVRDGEAKWVSTDPPTIKLRRSIKTPEIWGSKVPIVNWTDFFKEEKDIYVQNVANAQISLQFEVAPGHTQGFLVPHTRDPFNLTQHVPFAAVKSSADFRKMLN